MPKLDAITAALRKEAGLDPLSVAPFVMPAAQAAVAGSRAPDGEGGRAALMAGGGSLVGEGVGAAAGGTLGRALANRLWIPGADPKAAPLLATLATVLGGVGGAGLGALAGGHLGERAAKATSPNPYYRVS